MKNNSRDYGLHPGTAWTVVAILMLFGTAKLVSIFGKDEILLRPDPLLGIQNRIILLVLGIVEISLAIGIGRKGLGKGASTLLAMLGLQFLLYHFFKSSLHLSEGCPCLGHIGSMLGMSKSSAQLISIITALFLFLVGIYGAVLTPSQTVSKPA